MTLPDPSWLASAGPALLLAAVAGFVAGAFLGGPPCGPSPLPSTPPTEGASLAAE